MNANHTNHTALVTGANSGLGFEAAAQLAEGGYGRVILACRTLQKAEGARAALVERVGSDPFDTLAIDVADIASSKGAAAELIGRGHHIDALLLNAGMVPGDDLVKSADGLEMSYAASIVGHHVLTVRLLDAGLLDGARIVIAGSEAANNDLPKMMGMEVYGFVTGAPSTFGSGLPEAMSTFVHGGKPEAYVGTRTYSTTKVFTAWWTLEMGRRFGDRVSVFNVSPGANMSTNAARHATGFKRFLFTKVMPALGPLLGMDQPVAKGAGRYIAALHGDGEFVSGRTYTSAPGKMIGPVQAMTHAHLLDAERAQVAWSMLAELTDTGAIAA